MEWNHRITGVGKDLKDLLVPPPVLWGEWGMEMEWKSSLVQQ